MNEEILKQQAEVCARAGVPFSHADMSLIVGVAENVRSSFIPVNGLRHPSTEGVSGWYIWAGQEFSEHPSFFKPLHMFHLFKWRPEIIRFMALPPGWRFLKAGEYEDIWYDIKLFDV